MITVFFFKFSINIWDIAGIKVLADGEHVLIRVKYLCHKYSNNYAGRNTLF